MKKKLWVLIIVVLCLGITGIIIYNNRPVKEVVISGSIAHLTQEELILNSDLIITGTVTKINESQWRHLGNDKDGWVTVLQTDIEIKIDEKIFGEYDSDIAVVRVDKGYDKKTRTKYISDGFPDFYEGESVLMFLSRDDGIMNTGENYFLSTGMIQGKWSYDKETGKIDNDKTPENYSLEGKTIGEMKSEVKEQITKNPNYKEERALKREETRKRNIELFGE